MTAVDLVDGHAAQVDGHTRHRGHLAGRLAEAL
jgi:hypothetical protein